QMFLQLRDLAPVRVAGVHLPGGPSVQSDRLGALVLADLPEVEEVLAGLVETETELHRQRDRETAPDRTDDPPRERRVADQRGAGAALQDLVRGTPHVDVARIAGELRDDLGGGRHPPRIRAVDLD